jgi:hypothetical protein
MEILILLIPNLWEFLAIMFLMFFTIFFIPIFQSWILQFESFMLYPFICKKCCSFWLDLILNIILAYIFNPMFFVWGLITASVLAYMHYYSANH